MEFKYVAFLYCKSDNAVAHGSESHLRTLGVDKYGNLVRYASDIVNNLLSAFYCSVSGVDSSDIHTVKIKIPDEICLAVDVGYSADNLSFLLFHV